MLNATENFADFWAWCAQNGVVSKRLFIQRNVQGVTSELSLHAGEPMRAGAVVAVVPYLVTLNAQTIRGGMKPAAVPTIRALCTFLTRRGRMDVLTARSLWLASCLACHWRLLAQGRELCIAPLISQKMLPVLPSPFVGTNIRSYPAIAAALPGGPDDAVDKSFLATLKDTLEAQLRVLHAALQFYQRRRASLVSPQLVPTLDELRMAYRTVLHRGVLLPVDCVPSSPGDLADLLSEQPGLDVLPSLVPIVDIIRSPAAARSPAATVTDSRDDGAAAANCSLHTCTQADFISPATRRRVVLEVAPLSNRRVVVCAARELKEGVTQTTRTRSGSRGFMSEVTKINATGATCYKSTARAKAAYQKRDVELSRSEHQKQHPHSEPHNSAASDYIKSMVFGGLDGIMTTFAIVAAAVGSNSNYVTVLIFGFSNVLADGFSMGFGEYVSGDAERENALSERRREEWEVENAFDMEVDEMVQVYEARGLSHEDATTIVKIISKDPKCFVDFMMIEELGLLIDLSDVHGPKKQGVVMFISFLTFGTVPLLAYIPGRGQGLDGVFVASCLLAACALVVLGLLKGFLTGVSMLHSAALMLFNGVVSGLVSYYVGWGVESMLRAEFGGTH